MGGPKALLRDPDGTAWVARSCAALRDGGCGEVIVVLGAAADAAAPLVPAWARVVLAPDWDTGMGASLRAGLAATAGAGAGAGAELEATAGAGAGLGPSRGQECVAALVTLVDLPGVGAPVVRRLLRPAPAPGTLARAAYDGRPGHPVLLGRDHWAGVAAGARGDAGARAYLRGRDVRLVECGDLGHGDDVDTTRVSARRHVQRPPRRDGRAQP